MNTIDDSRVQDDIGHLSLLEPLDEVDGDLAVVCVGDDLGQADDNLLFDPHRHSVQDVQDLVHEIPFPDDTVKPAKVGQDLTGQAGVLSPRLGLAVHDACKK